MLVLELGWVMGLLWLLKPQFWSWYESYFTQVLQGVMEENNRDFELSEKFLSELESRGKLPFGIKHHIQSYLVETSVLPISESKRVEQRF